jgi:hypothetical protein
VHTFRPFAALLALGLALVLTGCGGHATIVRTIDAAELTSGSDAKVVTVHKDDNVVLDVGNSTPATCTFAIEGYGIHDPIDPGTPVKLKFKAVKPGTFKISCQPNAPAGQIATFVVE